MVVDRVVPEQGLVAVAPGVVLGADVLVGVLDALLEGGHVRPVLPVLRPEVVGVGAGEDQAGDDAAVWPLAHDSSLYILLSFAFLHVPAIQCSGFLSPPPYPPR